jgi:hypothetical protein
MCFVVNLWKKTLWQGSIEWRLVDLCSSQLLSHLISVLFITIIFSRRSIACQQLPSVSHVTDMHS